MDKKIIPMKKWIISITVFIALLAGYVWIVNINSKEMTGRQKLLKAFYPLFTGLNRMLGTNSKVLVNKEGIRPPSSIYDLQVKMIDGTMKSMADFKGKKLLIVNTASDCGYTRQYEGLQALYEQEKGNLEIIAFPANDFKEQEKAEDADIAVFCKRNYGVSFPLASKAVVVKGNDQDPVFQWLTDRQKNGWNGKPPSWNFSKYLVSEDGILLNYFDPAVEPDAQELIMALHGRNAE